MSISICVRPSAFERSNGQSSALVTVHIENSEGAIVTAQDGDISKSRTQTQITPEKLMSLNSDAHHRKEFVAHLWAGARGRILWGYLLLSCAYAPAKLTCVWISEPQAASENLCPGFGRAS